MTSRRNWTDFNIPLEVEDVLRGEGADPEVVRLRRPVLLDAANSALQEGSSKLYPAVAIVKRKVAEHRHERILFEDGNELKSPLVSRQMAGAEQIVFVVCTIGHQLEEYALTAMKADPLFGMALDGLGNSAVEILSQKICGWIAEEAQSIGFTASAPLSPGIKDWPVEVGQPQIFSQLDLSKAGVTLTSGGMMIPKKSISFIVGVGPEMVITDLCELCSLHERCRYRHA